MNSGSIWRSKSGGWLRGRMEGRDGTETAGITHMLTVAWVSGSWQKWGGVFIGVRDRGNGVCHALLDATLKVGVGATAFCLEHRLWFGRRRFTRLATG
jgi:hypothetical protein